MRLTPSDTRGLVIVAVGVSALVLSVGSALAQPAPVHAKPPSAHVGATVGSVAARELGAR